MRPARGNQGISGTRGLDISNLATARLWLRPDPDSARDTRRSFEITMRQTVPRYDMGIEFSENMWKVSWIRPPFFFLEIFPFPISPYLLPGEIIEEIFWHP